MEERDDVRLVVVDVESWGSPVAKQHGIRRLPTVWLFEGEDRVSTDVGSILRALEGR